MIRIINIKISKEKNKSVSIFRKVMKKYQIRAVWKKKIVNSIRVIQPQKINKEKSFRKDLRSLPFVTIDEKDAYDFDDAVYCYKIPNTSLWKLFVAISDVSFFVEKGSDLDKEALYRGTSIYFPLNVLPMLPEQLSNNLCSLLPNKDRLSIVCEMTLSHKGNLLNYMHYEAVIKSHARLTYEEVIKIWKNDVNLSKKFFKIKKTLKNFRFLSSILHKNKNLKKIIFFHNSEPNFIFHHSGKIKNIILKNRNRAHTFVELCMILANKSSALFLKKNNIISLFRNHKCPTSIQIRNFRNLLSKFNLTLKGGKQPLFEDYLKLFEKLKNKPYKEIIELELLKSTKKAFYSEKNFGHFGLSEKFYTHFTSPIRRYPDLMVHRGIKYFLKNKNNIKNTNNINAKRKSLYNVESMKKIARICSKSEKKADKAYKFFIDILKFDFIKRKIGKEFHGVIIHITEFGFFVKIRDLFTNGLVHVSTLKDDYYYYNRKNMTLNGKRFKKKFFLGDSVKVKIKSMRYKNKILDLFLI
ncbi:ribonuclease R family protein [Buchnera aphidicola]|uniref:ribonuclease R family protein n=1 Tax=Buchnera aphidicola TaxID=9 RepID=UPI003463E349